MAGVSLDMNVGEISIGGNITGGMLVTEWHSTNSKRIG